MEAEVSVERLLPFASLSVRAEGASSLQRGSNAEGGSTQTPDFGQRKEAQFCRAFQKPKLALISATSLAVPEDICDVAPDGAREAEKCLKKNFGWRKKNNRGAARARIWSY